MSSSRRQPGVLVIILCYNGVELTVECLRSLERVSYDSFDVLLVDNASQDGTPERVGREFPRVNLIETGRNLGYAGGNNIGLRYALEHGYDYVLLLNNDTEVEADLLDVLVGAAEAGERVGAVGPKIVYGDRPDVLWSAGGTIDWRRGRAEMRGLDEPDSGRYDSAAEVDFITGCALLVRCEAIRKAGVLDERFGMYFEETEWCVRLARAGWRLFYEPGTRVRHKVGATQHDRSARVTYYMARNRLLFLRLTGASAAAWLHAAVLQDLRTWCAWRLKRRWSWRAEQRAALSAAWRDFALNRFGMVK